MQKIFNKELQQVDFYLDNKQLDRKIWRDGDFVFKKDPLCLHKEWRKKLEKILLYIKIPTFYDFIDDGYITRYIDGPDLQGNYPFEMDGQKEQCILSRDNKLKVIPIFNDAIKVGKLLGYTLGDITCGNILIKDNELYQIDYEVITPYPLDQDYNSIWTNTLRIIFKDS